jgi:hypothetical protein
MSGRLRVSKTPHWIRNSIPRRGHIPAGAQPRYFRARPASVLILVIGLLVLLALIGTAVYQLGAVRSA